MSNFQQLKLSITKLGLRGMIVLLAEKQAKKRRLERLLKSEHGRAELTSREVRVEAADGEEYSSLVERADTMLADENYVFTFLHHLKDISDPWNYDPLEKKYWEKKRYEETSVHTPSSPKDVKIVWEVNRFKYLPLLAQAAFLTKEKKYADEIEWRLLSWIEGNPFAGSINWSSPLEIAIRGISWAATLKILSAAGYDLHDNEKVQRSIWEHAAYLNAELSTDKIVRSNHLIGETAGLYILSSFFNFPEAVFFKLRAKKILTQSILEQTYPDGATRESSGWYHTFVTDFADLALRTAHRTGDTFDKEFTERFTQMQVYRNSIILPDGDPVRFGDCDFGKAINLSANWKDAVFGENVVRSKGRKNYFEKAQHVTAMLDKNYFFVRAGDFGWGGDGFSSHSHDDFLSPVVAMDGANILVDTGTYVYNGSPDTRNAERVQEAHNNLIIIDPKSKAGPELKPSFGWKKTRPPAFIEKFSDKGNELSAKVAATEWLNEYARHLTLNADVFMIEDDLHFSSEKLLEWNFHFHPRWRVSEISPSKFALHDFRDNHYRFELSQVFKELEVLPYDFYPAYGQKSKAWKIRIRDTFKKGEQKKIKFELSRLQK